MLMGQDYVADDDCNSLQTMMSDWGVQKDYKTFCINNVGDHIHLVPLSIKFFFTYQFQSSNSFALSVFTVSGEDD